MIKSMYILLLAYGFISIYAAPNYVTIIVHNQHSEPIEICSMSIQQPSKIRLPWYYILPGQRRILYIPAIQYTQLLFQNNIEVMVQPLSNGMTYIISQRANILTPDKRGWVVWMGT